MPWRRRRCWWPCSVYDGTTQMNCQFLEWLGFEDLSDTPSSMMMDTRFPGYALVVGTVTHAALLLAELFFLVSS